MPLHPSFQKILDNYIKQYGEKKGKEYFYAWINEHGYDDKKDAKGQLSMGDTEMSAIDLIIKEFKLKKDNMDSI